MRGYLCLFLHIHCSLLHRFSCTTVTVTDSPPRFAAVAMVNGRDPPLLFAAVRHLRRWIQSRLSTLMMLVADMVAVGERRVSMERHDLLANGLTDTPPMGWNSWNHLSCNINETMIKETADALISTGLAKLGYKYVNIDDCRAEYSRDQKGNLVPKKSTFPSGIKALADYVHNKGLKLGIYSDSG
ncbi:alpha-galactosidase 1, partial [Tanacetum coccineum]